MLPILPTEIVRHIMGYARPTYPYMEQLNKLFLNMSLLRIIYLVKNKRVNYYDNLFEELEGINLEGKVPRLLSVSHIPARFLSRHFEGVINCYHPYCDKVFRNETWYYSIPKCKIQLCTECEESFREKRCELEIGCSSKKLKRQKYLNVTTIKTVKRKYPLLKFD